MLCSVFRSSRHLRQIAIPKKPLYRELDPETRKLYQKIIRVDHAGERGAGKVHQKCDKLTNKIDKYRVIKVIN